MNKKEIGNRIRAFMKEKGLKQEQLEKEIGLKQSSISDMINGKRDTIRLALILSEKYNVSRDYFLGNEESEERTNVFNPTTKFLPSDFDMSNKETNNFSSIEKHIEKLSKIELVNLVKELMALNNDQTEMYRMLIRQNEQMIRYGQERFNNITNIIFKNM